jgi:hypothetical protein
MAKIRLNTTRHLLKHRRRRRRQLARESGIEFTYFKKANKR